MNKYSISNTLLPICISFGPAFMILWIKSENSVNYMSMIGAVMLISGLSWMYSKVAKLEKEISEIKKNTK